MQIEISVHKESIRNLSLRDSLGNSIKFSTKRVFPSLIKYAKSDLEHIYPLGHFDKKSMMRAAIQKLLKEFLRHPIFFSMNLFHFYRLQVDETELGLLPLKLTSTNPSNKVWIGRQAVGSGIYPSDFDTTLEMDFARNPMQFAVMVRQAVSPKSRNFFSSNSYTMELPPPTEVPTVGFRMLRNVKVVGGRVVHNDISIYSPSNLRTEVALYRFGCIQQSPLMQSKYQVPSVAQRSIGLKQAIFVGFSSNWAHFVLECLPRLVRIPRAKRQGISVLLPENSSNQIREICLLLTGVQPILLEHLEGVEVEELLFGYESGFNESLDVQSRLNFLKQIVEEVRSVIPNHIQSTASVKSKLYLRRPRGLFRPIQNEGALRSKLNKFGFFELQPEQLDIRSLVPLLEKVDIIILEAGAAVMHLIFCMPQTRVLLLTPTKRFLNGPNNFWDEVLSVSESDLYKLEMKRCMLGFRGLNKEGLWAPLNKISHFLRNS